MNEQKPNYNERQYEPSQYVSRGYTDSFYDEHGESGAGSFLFGAIVGGVIGAAAALFLAPKTGKEMREDFSTQAVHLKDKGIEISTIAKDKAAEYSAVAKDKATEFSSIAKEKTDEVTKTIQIQSEQFVDKVKSMKSKTEMPIDDGTASPEEEETESASFIAIVEEKVEETVEETTATAEALKEAVVQEEKK